MLNCSKIFNTVRTFLIMGIYAFLPIIATAANDHPTQVELLMNTTGIQPNSNFKLAVHFNIQDPYHIYWKYPGTIGLPTKANLELPNGFQIKEEHWSLPIQFKLSEDYLNYGYSKEALIVFEIQAPKILNKSNYEFNVALSWLNCSQEICLPDRVNKTITISTTPKSSPLNMEIFKRWNSSFPVKMEEQAILKKPNLSCAKKKNSKECLLKFETHTPVEKISLIPNPIKPTKIDNLQQLDNHAVSFTIRHSQTDLNASCILSSVVIINRSNLSPIGVYYELPIC